MRPDEIITDNILITLMIMEADLPPSPFPRAPHIGSWPRAVTGLNGEITKIRPVSRQLNINDKPAFLEPQIFPVAIK